MQCINKIKAGFTRSGDLTFKPRQADQSVVGVEFECRKCLPCRLNIAREKAIRTMHEAKMHKNNIFLTLTYSDENLKNSRLNYPEFQQFMDTLRKKITRGITDPDLRKQLKISYMVTGEYGDKNKRPHWHVIIFNYRPSDSRKLRTTELGHDVFTSNELQTLWGKGMVEFGEVTLESANYVARYAAKKLAHGYDQAHDYHPIHKTSSANAIGKSWIEKYHDDTFRRGYVYLPNGTKTKIPRYYVDWLKKNHPEKWRHYVTQIRQKIQEEAQSKSRNEELSYLSELLSLGHGCPRPVSRNKVRLTILNQKFKKLQEKLKL